MQDKAKIAKLTTYEYKKYIDSLDAYREVKGIRETAIEEGMNMKAVEMAKEMIKDKESIEKINKYTKLSKDTVEELINELKNSH